MKELKKIIRTTLDEQLNKVKHSKNFWAKINPDFSSIRHCNYPNKGIINAGLIFME